MAALTVVPCRGRIVALSHGGQRVRSSLSQKDLMAEETERQELGHHSRRSFLGKLSLGLAAAAGAGFLLRNLVFSGARNDNDPADQLPGEDSIFHPREDVLERYRKG